MTAAFLTDFADQGVILPLAVAIAAVLAAMGWWRGLLAWLTAVGGVLGSMLLLKVVFYGTAGLAAAAGIRSPSGHTASAAVVYGGLAVLLSRGRLSPATLVVLAVLATGLVGATRLVLHVHTPIDVAVGALVGLAGAAWLARLARPWPSYPVWPLGLIAATVATACHGIELPVEQTIRHLVQAPIAG